MHWLLTRKCFTNCPIARQDHDWTNFFIFIFIACLLSFSTLLWNVWWIKTHQTFSEKILFSNYYSFIKINLQFSTISIYLQLIISFYIIIITKHNNLWFIFFGFIFFFCCSFILWHRYSKIFCYAEFYHYS